MSEALKGKTIAMLVAPGFEQSEMTEPRKALQEAGAAVHLISPKKEEVRGWNHKGWGDDFPVDVTLLEARAEDYDALVLPGGVMNPDFLRQDRIAVDFVTAFFTQGKPVGAICHAPWTLIEAGVVRGRRMTSYPSLRTDLLNAGAEWVDREVVADGGLVTSRKPDDIPAFTKALIETIAAGRPATGPGG